MSEMKPDQDPQEVFTIFMRGIPPLRVVLKDTDVIQMWRDALYREQKVLVIGSDGAESIAALVSDIVLIARGVAS